MKHLLLHYKHRHGQGQHGIICVECYTDDNVKVKAHYAMAQIYDDVNQFKPAIEHYMAAVSFAGETDNFKAQIKSLTKIGNIYADKYDKEAFNVYDDAKIVADESKDFKNKVAQHLKTSLQTN